MDVDQVVAAIDEAKALQLPTTAHIAVGEATRDLIKAQNLPWHKDYLHPSLEEYFKPSMTRHATFFMGWTEAQELN